MFASVRTHPSCRYLVKRGTQQPRIFVSDCSACEMRYKAAFDLDNGEYRYANGIELASGYVVSY